MPDFLDTNLVELERTHPQLAARIRALPGIGDDLEPLPGKRGQPTVRARLSDGRSVLIHSQYDPQTEAQRAAQAVRAEDAMMAVVFGFGLGYHVEALWNLWGAGLDRVIVLEGRLDLFALALGLRDLRPLLSNPKISFEVASEPLDIYDHLFNAILSLLTCSPILVPHNPSMELAPAWYESAREQLVVAMRIGKWSAQTKIVLGRSAFSNVLENYLSVSRVAGVEPLFGQFAGLPGFVVSAGPSLDRNVEQLREVGDRGVIICVDTALRRLVSAGVRPHIVCTIDPLHLTMGHFGNVQPPPDSVLVFDIECYPAAQMSWPGAKGVIWLRKNPLLIWLEEQIGTRGDLEKGNTVAHTSFYLARALGTSPIIFVGQDLAYTREPGASHSSATAYRSTWRWANEARTHIIQPSVTGEPQVTPIFWVPGVDGQPVPTTPQLYSYLRQFERKIRQAGVQCIDATEGGARIHGTEVATLADCVQRFCTRDGAVTRRLHAVLDHPPDDTMKAQDALKRYRRVLLDCRAHVEQAIQVADRAAQLLAQTHPDERLLRTALNAMLRHHAEAFTNPLANHSVEQASAAVAFRFLQERQKPDRVRDKAYWTSEVARYRGLFEGAMEALAFVLGKVDHALTASAMSADSS